MKLLGAMDTGSCVPFEVGFSLHYGCDSVSCTCWNP